MTVSKEEVERFLSEFHSKMRVFGIIFRDDRGKNLEAKDYVEGPIVDTLNHNGEMWVFGRDVKESEVYIKISMGMPGRSTICISFHRARYEMNYPFREE